MKDNLLDGHRGKVAANVTTTPTGSGKTEVVGGPGPTNFDDDYNEWELGIGDLIIDLDADIEKNNDKYHGLGGEGSVTFGLLTQQSCDLTTTSSMSNSKQCRMTGNSNSGSNSSSGGGASSTGTAGTVEHQATVDKGLKMKIKRKNVGSKFSEAKHEIVQSDTKVAHQTPPEVGVTSNCTQNNQQAESKSKHSSGKGRSTSHREKKEKNKDKGSNKTTTEVNGVVNNTHNVVSASIKLTNNNTNNSNNNNTTTNNTASSTPPAPATPLPPAPTPVAPCEANNAVTTTNCLPSILPSLTVKLETKYSSLPANSTVLLKPEDLPKSPPPKRARVDKGDPMRDAGTSTSVGTITEPECLGPCEPGTSVTLEGIVWQETEGGVLVVNVTWRGKTYVGTLLDCTKHDWAPPRFCESPTSDIDAKTSKARGKRGRASTGTANEVNNYNESRATVQSKLRNCKGRRSTSNSSNSTNSGFTVPSSPAKSDSGTCSNGKRKGRPADLELNVTTVDNKGSKRSRSQARSTPTPSNNALTDFTQPSSPVLIECPEPNCSKKYKHINGLRYHQTHAHSNPEAGKIEDMLEDGKDTTNSSDNDESMQDSASVSPSPAITTFPSSVSPHSHDSNNRTLPAPESLNILDMSTPAEAESYPEATDLSTLASVAISDSKKNNAFVHLTTTNTSSSSVIKCQDNGEIPANSETTKPICVNIPISAAPANLSSHVGLTATSPVSLSSPSLTNYATSVSSNSSVPSVTASIPTSHVLFNQTCTVGSSTTTTASSLMNLTSTATMSAMCSVQSNNITTFFTPSVPSTGSALPTAGDKSKLEKADKYKIKSSGAAIVRPVIPVPPTQVLSTSNAPQPSSSTSHSHVTSSLKPIQPKPTILGEPTTINPALESLKKEKSKHKKKSKERDKDKKGSAILQPTKSQILPPTEEAERLGRSSFDSLDSPLTKTITNATGISPSQQKPIVASISNAQSLNSNSDSNAADSSNINENVQSPAYSDISDANDSAPVLESEVPSNKDKDEVKSPPEVASQTAAASLGTYGMYSYYSNPPYLIPSVPQNSVPSSTLNVEKGDSEKKSDTDRSKDVRNWNCQPSEVKVESANVSQEKTGKKTPPEEVQANSSISSAVASSSNGQQEYPIQQQYAYPYGYMQGYPYSAVDASYHMHLLTTDPHYKQQCDQYLEEQERIYREQAERQKEHVERQKEHAERQHKEHIEKQHKEQERQHKEQERHHKEQERHHKEQERHHKEQERHHKEQERQHKEQERQHKEHSEKHHKDQSERQHKEHIDRPHKDQAERHKLHIQHSQMRSKDDRNREKMAEEKGIHPSLSGASVPSDLSKQASVGNTVIATKDREIRPPSHPSQSRTESSTTPSISPVVSTTTPLKEKQNENHQILKENIELKSQMDAGKVKLSHYESAMLYDRQHEMRRFYMMQEGLIDPHQKPDREHSQQQQQQPLQGRKEEMFGTVVMKNKSCAESTRPTSVILSPKSDSAKSLSSSSSSSSPKGTSRESSLFSKDYSANSAPSKKESASSVKPAEHSESSSREEKHKSEKAKAHAEGQKPTMETTGPPPPPTNSYAYIQPSYIQPSHLQPTHLQPSHPHFAHIPFDSIYRGSLSPMLMSTPPHYGGSHFIHPQLRYHVPSAPCEIPPHNQTVSDSLGSKLHAPTQAKALDLLHQVSQHYTCTSHKIHELHERALMSPTASTAPSAAQGSSQSKVSNAEPAANSSKQETICSNERSQSPPPQRHLHTHHHTHVGVGYPLYDPYGATHPHWKQAQNQRRVSYRLTDQCDLMGKKIKEQEVP